MNTTLFELHGNYLLVFQHCACTEAAAGVEPPSSAAKSSTSSSGGGGGEGDLVKLPKSNGAVVKRTSLPVKALDTPDPVKHASVDNRPAAGTGTLPFILH
jgi:hypothetical protein